MSYSLPPENTPHVDLGSGTQCNDCTSRYCVCLSRLKDADINDIIIPTNRITYRKIFKLIHNK